MTLSPMRYKDYVWPHNPKVFGMEYRRVVASRKVPFGASALQSMGRTNRVLRGEGEFAGSGAYAEFKKLAAVFYEDTPGVLVHPVWQTSSAWFVALSLRQEPAEDYVRYSFEFWECCDGYGQSAVLLSAPAAVSGPASAAAQEWYTVRPGDTLWGISSRNGLTLAALVALNPQIKNPNLIYAGDQVRIR